MPSIDDLLDQATPDRTTPPSAAMLIRTIRRRRAVGFGGVAAASVLILGGLGFAVLRGGDETMPLDVVATQTEPTTTELDSEATGPSSPSHVEPAPVPSSGPPEAVGTVLDRHDAVIASVDGVFIRRAANPSALEQISDDPAETAYLLPDGTTVYQNSRPDSAGGPGPVDSIEVVAADSARTVTPADGYRYELLDARVVDGTPTILATIEFRNAGTFDADEQLVSIDIATGAETPLGSTGGGEVGASAGRLFNGGVALHRFSEGADWTELRDHSGTVFLSQPNGVDGRLAVVVDGDDAFELRPSATLDPFVRTIVITPLEPNDSTTGPGRSLALKKGATVTSADFCLDPQLVEQTLLCEQRDGPPFEIDFTSGRTSDIAGVERGSLKVALPGIVTTGAAVAPSEPEGSVRLPAECASDEAPPAEASPAGSFDLDGDGTGDLSVVASISPDERSTQIYGIFLNGSVTTPAETNWDPRYLHLNMSELATGDLDGDGNAELFFRGLGNTARQAMVLRFDGCNLHTVSTEDGELALLLIGVGGNSCAPTGCFTRVHCVDGADGVELEAMVTSPEDIDVNSEPIPHPNDVPIDLTVDRYRLVGNTLELVGSTTTRHDGVDDLPDDAPTPDDSDRIQC